MQETDRIKQVNIEEEMKSSYIDYSMSVIVSRALPDVRDGFKPVHRRILYGMMDMGITHDKATKKSAAIVGEVLGKYHPHGDSSVYGALVRMAQPWAMRYPLVIGQGNFGSMDGDGAAAMRYTEAKMSLVGEAMMQDIEKETVDMNRNYDNSRDEPSVLPTRIPSFLVNGATGIAVGMATNVPTHNLGEVIDGCVAYIDNPEIDVDGLMQHIKGPDFPTGAYILGNAGIRSAYDTGRGRVIIRAKAEIETGVQHDKIVIRAVPYGTNTADLVKSIAQLSKENRVEGITNVNDESDREGMRIVVDVKRGQNANVVLNKLYKMTGLQTSFAVNCIALVPIPGTSPAKMRPKLLTLKECIKQFVDHRHDVVIRRTRFDLRKAQERQHILRALIIASDNIDEVVAIIRSSRNTQEAQERLMSRFELDEIQAKAIVEMRLAQLTGLQQEKLHAEFEELEKKIAYFNKILSDSELCKKVIKDELIEVKEAYGDERKTEILPDLSNFNAEDFYADDEVVITISHLGYIKRTPLAEFRAQGRGGVGAKGGSTRDQDFIEYIYQATMHNTMLFFTAKGRCYWLRVYEIEEGTRQSKGRAIQNMLNIEPDDRINACLHIRKLKDETFCENHYVVFATQRGVVKKTRLTEYSRPRTNGVNAININEDDRVVSVVLTNGTDELVMANKNGRAIRFNESVVRTMGRNATGVRGMLLDNEADEIVGMVCVNDAERESILVVSEQGYGKRSAIDDYRVTNRGGKGVRTLNITDKTGNVVAIKSVTEEEDLMIINKSGITLRLRVADIRLAGRATQGVRLIDLKKRNDIISSVCQVPSSTEEDEEEIEQVLNEDSEYTSDNVTDTTDSINDSSDGDVVENADI
ncbi:DNA gyrase subunit A [Alloprevotella sp. oral taxon 473]|uniref:DNA gyrase subunit A n=1 Tax=Alloprevotella sp. oral taxon 473 TaxID=712469 RepID=UPI0005C72234|nr:DNA gyrase subunit A [Alloprevotella sp. oral taxon 473]